jgi:hypothetical protein
LYRLIVSKSSLLLFGSTANCGNLIVLRLSRVTKVLILNTLVF